VKTAETIWKLQSLI